MATSVQERAKRCTFFINGDRTFPGKRVVINRRSTRNIEACCDFLTNSLRTPLPVRGICTPVGGTRLDSLDSFEEDGNYVAVLNGRFKKFGYLTIPEGGTIKKQTPTPRSTDVKPVEHSRIQVSARIRKVPTSVVTIFVYANGKNLEPARRVTLTHQLLQNWEGILAQITEKVNLDSGACRKICTVDGQQITSPSGLQTGQYYVAVGADVGGFKKLDYGSSRPMFNNSPRRERKKFLLEPIPGRGKRRSKPRQEGDSQNTTTQSSPTSTDSGSKSTAKTNRTGASNASKRPKQSRPKKEEDGVFHAKPVKHKRSSEKTRPPPDPDRDEGGVFKAKETNRETRGAQEVEETRDTQVELPIDQVEAEEVQEEEIIEDTEDKNNNNDNQLEPELGRDSEMEKPAESPTKSKPASPVNQKSSTPNRSQPQTPVEDTRRSVTPERERFPSPELEVQEEKEEEVAKEVEEEKMEQEEEQPAEVEEKQEQSQEEQRDPQTQEPDKDSQ